MERSDKGLLLSQGWAAENESEMAAMKSEHVLHLKQTLVQMIVSIDAQMELDRELGFGNPSALRWKR